MAADGNQRTIRNKIIYPFIRSLRYVARLPTGIFTKEIYGKKFFSKG